MDESSMFTWFEKVWQTCAKEKRHNAFTADKTYNVKVLLFGCTSKCQPLNVCINKPFKGILLYCLNSFFLISKASLNIYAHLSMKIILVDPTLEHSFFANNFFDPNYGTHRCVIIFWCAINQDIYGS